MKQYMYIRFFNDKDDGVPVNSEVMANMHQQLPYVTEPMKGVEQQIYEWIVAHPNGKVDFVLLGDTPEPPRRLSPIEMMVDKATGFDRANQNLVTLRCPTCKKEKLVTRDDSWHPLAAVVEYPCPSCPAEGDVRYLDSNGKQIST